MPLISPCPLPVPLVTIPQRPRSSDVPTTHDPPRKARLVEEIVLPRDALEVKGSRSKSQFNEGSGGLGHLDRAEHAAPSKRNISIVWAIVFWNLAAWLFWKVPPGASW